MREDLAIIASTSQHQFVKDAQGEVEKFLNYVEVLPEQYEWRDMELGAFRRLMHETPPRMDAYWHHMCNHLAAYVFVTLSKGQELVRETVEALNKNRVLPAAACCRSLFETSAMFLCEIGDMEATYRNLVVELGENAIRERLRTGTGFVASSEMEEHLWRLTHGTRIRDLVEEGYPEQMGASKYIKRLTECWKWLFTRYQELCDLAHPSLISNAVFCSRQVDDPHTGEKIRTLVRGGKEHLGLWQLELILAPLCWSGIVLHKGSVLALSLQESIRDLFCSP